MNAETASVVELLHVGPDEVLILRCSDDWGEHVTDLVKELERIGLKDRALVLSGDIEMSAVAR